MANLIDFDDPQPKSQNLMPCALNKLFGVIKRECFAIEVTGMDDCIGEKLQPGILIQIIPDYRGDQCHFTNWLDKNKTMIYKCTKDDFIVVTGELWPYLLALKNDEGRVKLVQNVYNKEFDLNMVKLGSDIRIRGPPGTVEKYYEFRVTYNGVVKEIGTGYYIGLQFKNDGISLTSDLKCLSRYYRFGGTMGIVVALDWIMLNLYKEEEYQYETPITSLNKVSSDIEMIIVETEAKENIFENVRRHLPIIEQRKKTNETGVLAKMCNAAPSCVTEIENNMGVYRMKKTRKMFTSTRPINRQPKKLSETSCVKPHTMAYDRRNGGSKTTRIETGAMSTRNLQSSENSKTEFNNNTVEPLQMKPNDWMQNAENNYVRTSPTTVIGITPKQLRQTPENPSHTTSNYVAEIELITNVDGAVKNCAKTKCDLCSVTVEIGHGIILRECVHSFCTQCITVHVESNLNYSRIRCPYKKDYECEFDLLDAEIKDLGGGIIYNKILENRLKEYLGTDPNARECPDKAIIFLQPNKTIETGAMSMRNHQSPENPKAELNNNAVGPMQMRPNNRIKNSENNYVRTSPNEIGIIPRQHHQPTANPSHVTSNYVAEIELIDNLDGAVRNVQTTKCDLCSTTVEIGHGIILRECLHSFCTQCITDHVERDLNYSGIRCPYKKDYECEFDLQDAEIKDLGGEIVYNKILENRLKEYVGTEPNARVCPNMNWNHQNPKIQFNNNAAGPMQMRPNDRMKNVENSYVRTSPLIVQPNKTIEPDGMSIRIQSPENPKTEFNNNAVGPMQMRPNDQMKNVENNYVRTSPLIVQPNKTIEPDGMSIRIQSPENPKTEFNNNAVGPMQMRPNDQMKNVENNYVRTSPLIVQPNKTIDPDGMSTRNHQNPKIQFNNNAAGPMQMRPNDRMKNSENNYVRTSPNEIGILPRQHHQPTENSSYVAETELIDNLDGAVRNVEKTKCDLCSATVEIRHGIILRECLHSFCTRCITIHVESNLNHSGIRCPYKKDYECEFDLQDAEIKDLGGEIVYNKILENRLKEYVGADPNATRCPNMDCGYVWVNVQREHKNYEHCPECNAGWCFVCQSSHERGERHGNNSGKFTLYNKIKSKIFGIDSTEPTVVCAKCRMTIISATEYVRLQKCNHIFCKSCILPMIKSQTSGSRYAQCAVCNSNLEDKELAKIAGLEVLNLFLGNRKLQKDSDVLQEMCICGPSVSNCSVELKCKHKFCRTYIVGLVQEQLSSSHRAACPRCLQEIDKSQIRRIVPGLIKEENIETCKLCANQVDVHLEICKHGFCHKCVRVMITKQVFDPSEKNVTCTSCHEHITDREISMYGSDKIFAQYKSKFEDFKFIPKSASPTKTCVCKSQIVNCRFTLKCGHTFCRTYIADIVKNQLNNKGAACPTCNLEIDKIEIGYLGPGAIENEVVNKCQNCSNQVGVRLANCQHGFCLKCLQSIITTLVFDPKKPFLTCNSCDENRTEISTYGSKELFARYKTKFGATPKPVNHITLTEKPFECDTCDRQISIKGGGIILAGCRHWFCIECCKESIHRQLSISRHPACPLCLKELAQYEIEALIGKPNQIS